MSQIMVDLGDRSYPIEISAGAMLNTALLGQFIKSSNVFLISNTTVSPLYAQSLTAVLEQIGKSVHVFELPDGEAYKNMDSIMAIMHQMLSSHCDRKVTVIALGGGVVGDMAGFAASCFLRGVPFIQIPTTLLSQVDSSVGGKTGINHPLGKNMIGAFYQPVLVLADVNTLDTLPDRELSAGLAEIIKHGLISDFSYFEWVEQNMSRILNREKDALVKVIEISCQIKSQIVAQDEKESGVRAILNFGHTFGHAIETGMGYGVWLHGEAVAAGMVLAGRASQLLGYISNVELQRVINVIQSARLPVDPPKLGVEKMLALMSSDKKSEDGAVKFIVLKSLGQAKIQNLDADVLEKALQTCV